VSRYISLRDFDWVLLTLVLLICAIGVVQIYSATLNTKFVDFHIKQIYWIVAGVIVMFITSTINYQVLLEKVPLMYVASIASLVAVLLFGRTYLGAKRWIMIGGQHFQPSEWVKLVLILAMAKYFAEGRQREGELGDIIRAGMLIGFPMFLVLIQPDLGTSLTYCAIAIMGLFLGGLRMKHAAIVLLIFTLLTPVIYKYGLKEYQRHRLITFVNPEADPQHKGYQVIQSLIAVGSGGITGKGPTKGTQVQGAFLPIPQTDFIFSAFAEEWGFVGVVVVLLLYFMVLMRLVANAQTAPDRAGAFVIMGVVAVLTFHILVNIGMVVGFAPVTGIPLPLMSYGGSAMLFTFLALGIVMNIRMRRFVN